VQGAAALASSGLSWEPAAQGATRGEHSHDDARLLLGPWAVQSALHRQRQVPRLTGRAQALLQPCLTCLSSTAAMRKPVPVCVVAVPCPATYAPAPLVASPQAEGGPFELHLVPVWCPSCGALVPPAGAAACPRGLAELASGLKLMPAYEQPRAEGSSLLAQQRLFDKQPVLPRTGHAQVRRGCAPAPKAACIGGRQLGRVAVGWQVVHLWCLQWPRRASFLRGTGQNQRRRPIVRTATKQGASKATLLITCLFALLHSCPASGWMLTWRCLRWTRCAAL
jgi:hypothetical protein